ncbi:MAG: hypothetical protein R3Y63_13560 [Eubacteriales bacterium]
MMFWLLGYFAPLFYIPTAVFFFTKLDEKQNKGSKEQRKGSLFHKFLLFDGDAKKMLIVEVAFCWIMIFLLTPVVIITGISGLPFEVMFILYLIAQVYHYVNLVTTDTNKEKMRKFCFLYSVPDIYFSTIGLVALFPALLWEMI